ncbi:MAG: transposase [Candidatus Geothermincolia bacterium]
MALRITEEQWDRIRYHFPEENIPDSRQGRKPVPARHVLEGALWILNTDAQWHMIPSAQPYKHVVRLLVNKVLLAHTGLTL